MLKKYNKLVRDKIPEIIERSGKKCETATIKGFQYQEYLIKKLEEELIEYKESSDPKELADILEVIYALASFHGASKNEIEDIREKKKEKRGGFEKGLLLKKVWR